MRGDGREGEGEGGHTGPTHRACGSAGNRGKSLPQRLAECISHPPERRERWEMEMVGGQVTAVRANKEMIIKDKRTKKKNQNLILGSKGVQ